MRRTKRIKIDDKEITVKELTPREIMGLGDKLSAFTGADAPAQPKGKAKAQPPAGSPDVGSDVNLTGQVQGLPEKPKDKIGFDAIKKALQENLTLAVEGITLDEMLDMAPSDLKTIWEEFKGVNTVFFEVVQKVGLGNLLHSVAQTIQRDFLSYVVDLSKLAI